MKGQRAASSQDEIRRPDTLNLRRPRALPPAERPESHGLTYCNKELYLTTSHPTRGGRRVAEGQSSVEAASFDALANWASRDEALSSTPWHFTPMHSRSYCMLACGWPRGTIAYVFSTPGQVGHSPILVWTASRHLNTTSPHPTYTIDPHYLRSRRSRSAHRTSLPLENLPPLQGSLSTDRLATYTPRPLLASENSLSSAHQF